MGIFLTAGVLLLSFTEIFSENWFIGLGLIGAGIVVIILGLFTKMRK